MSSRRHQRNASARTLAAAIATATERVAAQSTASDSAGRHITYYPDRLYVRPSSPSKECASASSTSSLTRCQRAIVTALEKKDAAGAFDPPVHLLENVATALEFMIGAGRLYPPTSYLQDPEEERAELDDMWSRVDKWSRGEEASIARGRKEASAPPPHPHPRGHQQFFLPERKETAMSTTSAQKGSKFFSWKGESNPERSSSHPQSLFYSEKLMDRRLQLHNQRRLRELTAKAAGRKNRHRQRGAREIPVTKYRTRVIEDFVGMRKG
jgi:hypothetical protein